MITRIAARLLLASTLLLGGCSEAPAPVEEAADPAAPAAADPAAPAGVDTDAPSGGGTQQLMAGTVTARFATSPEETLIASECAITNGGANGIIRAGDGAFELSWAGDTYRLIWNHGDAVYQGEVTGSVIEGGGATFNGSANGQNVQGFAVCTAGM